MTSRTRVPRVSVLLPVYNGANFVVQAVQSILAQTFTNFELVVVNDGSTDTTKSLLNGIVDARVRVVHQHNQGLARALNNGLALCRGEYVARQDHDDISLPTRLAQQVAYMDANPQCALLGTRAAIYVDEQPTGRAHDHPLGNAALQFALLFDNPFVHSSVMIRKSALDSLGGYTTDSTRQPPEDFELWSRIARDHRVANLPERLLRYREVPNSLSRRSHVNPFDLLLPLAAENVAACMDEPNADSAMNDLVALSHGRFDQLSPGFDLLSVLRVLNRAARRIDAGRGDSELLCLVKRMRTLLCRNYLKHRLPHPLRSCISLLRRVIR